MKPDLPDISFGEAGKMPDLRPLIGEDEDEEREEDEPTPKDVKEILGFDPDEESEDADRSGD